MKTRLAIFIFLAIIIALAAVIYIHKKYALPLADNNPVSVNAGQANPPAGTSTLQNQPGTATTIPQTLLLKVPFTPQAPTGNWDTIHNEDCEEASSLMANAYYNGPHDVKLDPSYVEGQLTKLTTWETQNFGYDLSITSEETVKMIMANYNLQAQVVYNFSEDDIKNYLAQNKLVLIPENGQMLGNPNYRSPGPVYHMLVIRGYTSSAIITNDSGTRNGLDYSYSFNTLYDADGDFSHATNTVDLSDKNIIVVWK